MKKAKNENVSDAVVRFLNDHPGRAFRSRELAKQMGIGNAAYPAFRRTLKQSVEDGIVVRHNGGRYAKALKPTGATGILRVKTQGYGFVMRDDGGEDVFVSEKNMNTAQHQDRVRVELWAQPAGKLPEGRVVEILERGHKRIVGTFREARTYNYVIPDELKLSKDIFVHENNRGKAQDGQKVVVNITTWSDSRKMPEGHVAEVLGFPDQKGVDVLSVAYGFDLPMEFPEVVEREAQRLPQALAASDLENRLDLRDRLIFTIDPDDAKDFDDAVSLEDLPNGNQLLGVHIADVSHYVRPGSAIDLEALSRGTSVYLVDRVIPMLPESLSGGLCSLKPDEDRPTFSLLMELSRDGNLVQYEIRETVIHSKRRLTYRQAHDLIEAERNRSSDPVPDRKNLDDLLIQKTLVRMADLSRRLLSGWQKAGSIDFNLPEAEVVLRPDGKPSDLRVHERLESHRLVEAFMLLANRTVAEHVHNLRQKSGMKLTFVYRIHEKPKGDKLAEFVRFVRALGYAFDPGDKVSPKKFQRFLDQIQGTPHEVVVEEVALRTMMKAIYSTENAGHFGLAFKHYTHFTSPIRRYPDLTVHRLLKSYLKPEPERPQLALPLSKICESSTEREIIAQNAERESIKAKQVEFMEDKIGEEFDGVVSGVVVFGIFVEIPQYLVEGLVHVNDLNDDYYVFDEKHYRLVGQNTRRIYRLGDPVRVRVAQVLKDKRKIDFVLAETEERNKKTNRA